MAPLHREGASSHSSPLYLVPHRYQVCPPHDHEPLVEVLMAFAIDCTVEGVVHAMPVVSYVPETVTRVSPLVGSVARQELQPVHWAVAGTPLVQASEYS